MKLPYVVRLEGSSPYTHVFFVGRAFLTTMVVWL